MQNLDYFRFAYYLQHVGRSFIVYREFLVCIFTEMCQFIKLEKKILVSIFISLPCLKKPVHPGVPWWLKDPALLLLWLRFDH